MSIYDFVVKDQAGVDTPLSKYADKVLLIVNTATHCGFTPQYKGLQELYKRYNPQGFEILDFPCNQFGKQAPGTAEEVHDFCELKYQTTFPRFAKIEVNGPHEYPLYTYLKSQKSGALGSKIKWNFTKFLIDRNGDVVARFGPNVKPEEIATSVDKLLGNRGIPQNDSSNN